MRGKPVIAYPYYGGKASMLAWTLETILPAAHDIYVEPFWGSGAVGLNKEPAKLNAASDADDRIVNFFRVLREKETELVRALQLTPYHQGEFQAAQDEDGIGDVERARRFVVRVCMARCNAPNNKSFFTPGLRASGEVPANLPDVWKNRWTKRVHEVAEKAKVFSWEHVGYEKLMRRFDVPKALIYLDPPYLAATRVARNNYIYDSSSQEFHADLLERALASKAKVAISGYASALYDDALKDWRRFELQRDTRAGSKKGKKVSKRTEVIWRNYDLDKPEQNTLLGSGYDSAERRDT